MKPFLGLCFLLSSVAASAQTITSMSGPYGLRKVGDLNVGVQIDSVEAAEFPSISELETLVRNRLVAAKIPVRGTVSLDRSAARWREGEPHVVLILRSAPRYPEEYLAFRRRNGSKPIAQVYAVSLELAVVVPTFPPRTPRIAPNRQVLWNASALAILDEGENGQGTIKGRTVDVLQHLLDSLCEDYATAKKLSARL